MCVRDVIHQIKQIFLSPKSMWTEISSQTVTTESVYIRWIVGFALLSTFSRSASVFMGMYVEPKKLNLSFNLLAFSTMTAINFVLNILFVFAVSLAISEMAPFFGGKRNLSSATRMVGYAITPLWLFSILEVVTVIAIVLDPNHWDFDAGFASLWALGSIVGSAYFVLLVFNGVTSMMQSNEKKRFPYSLFITLISVVIQGLLYLCESGFVRGISSITSS